MFIETFVRNISCCDKYPASYITDARKDSYKLVGLHVKYILLWCHFNPCSDMTTRVSNMWHCTSTLCQRQIRITEQTWKQYHTIHQAAIRTWRFQSFHCFTVFTPFFNILVLHIKIKKKKYLNFKVKWHVQVT